MPSANEILTVVDRAMSDGQFLAAHDHAMHGLVEYPNELLLKHRAVLAIVRTGAVERAAELFRELGLAGMQFPSSELQVEIGSLEARIEKDRGLRSSNAEQHAHFTTAQRLYVQVFEETNDYYPGINAAALALWIGDKQTACGLARACIDLCSNGQDYYALATMAEAYLLLEDCENATRAIAAAAAKNPGRDAAVSTRRQLLRSCRLLDIKPGLLDPLACGPVLRYLGHMPWPGLDEAAQARLKKSIRHELTGLQVEVAYGALAAGADILIAEMLIEQGIELHVILPFDVKLFMETSVTPYGPEWISRFEHCLARADSLIVACEGGQPADGTSYHYCSRYTMGACALFAHTNDTVAHQFAIWDGSLPEMPGGTSEDIQIWHDLGQAQTLLSTKGALMPDIPRWEAARAGHAGASREIRAVLFADFAGFSKLTEVEIKPFIETTLSRVAAALAPFDSHVLSRNTWGDGLFIIIEDAPIAAQIALSILQSLSQAADSGAKELPIRIGLHLAPMTRIKDPITGNTTFIGTEISKAARIEPITPPNTIFVTEAFAGELALAGDGKFMTEYMGQVELAKSAGAMPVFRLVGYEIG